MKPKNILLTGLVALSVAGCASTMERPCDRFGKIDNYKDHWDFILDNGWAVNTVKPINGQMLVAPGIPRVYIVSEGKGTSLRGYAWELYRDPDAWLYLVQQNPELKSYDPDEILPAGMKIPAQMLEWQILGFQEVCEGKIIPQDSASAEFFKSLKK